MSRRGLIAALLLAVCAAEPARAETSKAAPPADHGPAELATLLQRLQATQASVQGLSAEFTQRSRVKLFRQELTSQGRLFYQKGQAGQPARLRWEYTAPDPSVLVLIGEQAELRAPGQAPRRFDTGRDGTLRAVFDQMGLWLGSGALQTAQRDNQLRLLGSAAAPTLELAPKDGTPLAKVFQRVELRLDGKTLLLRSLLLVERSGDEREITMSKLKTNPQFPKDLF